jgi:hypothetical protein
LIGFIYLTQIPETPFLGMVGIATDLIMTTGGIFFGINKAKWIELFGIVK